MTECQRHVTANLTLSIVCLVTGVFVGILVPSMCCSFKLNRFSQQTASEDMRKHAFRIVKDRATIFDGQQQVDDFILNNASNLTRAHWHALLRATLEYHDDEFFRHLLVGMSKAQIDLKKALFPFRADLSFLPLPTKLILLTWLDYDTRRQLEPTVDDLTSTLDSHIDLLLKPR